MYKSLIVIFIVFTTSISYANTPFYFNSISYKKALKQSKVKKMEVLLFFNLSDDEFCKKVEKQLFDKPEVANVYRTKFINLKIDPKTKEGEKLAKKYSVFAYPSIVFINAKEEIVHKIIGLNSKTDMLDAANRVVTNNRSLKYYNDIFNEDSKKIVMDHHVFLDYINVLYNAGEEYSDKVELYFNSLSDSELKLPENVDAIIRFSENMYSREFVFFAKNYTLIGALSFNENDKLLKLEGVISNNVIAYLQKKPNSNPSDTLNAILDYFSIEQRELVESRVMLDYYEIINQNKEMYDISLRNYMMLHLGYLSTGQIVDYCSYVLGDDNKELYQDALLWTEESVNSSLDFDIYYTRILLLIKVGRIDEARNEIQRIKDVFGDNLTLENENKLKELKLVESDNEINRLEIIR